MAIEPDSALKAHEMSDKEHFSKLEHEVSKVHDKVEHLTEKMSSWYEKAKNYAERMEDDEDDKEDHEMSGIAEKDINVYTNGGGMGGGFGGYGYGDGFGGGGVLGALIVASLFGNRGFGRDGFDNGGCHNRCATTDDVMDAEQMGILADIRAAVPLSEAQLQLGLAQAQDTITTTTLEQTIALKEGQFELMQGNFNTLFQLSGQLSAGNLALSTAIHNEGEKTRELITANQIAELNRLAAERQDEIIELRNERRRDSDRHSLEITMNNNQSQNQLQAQAQVQAQALFNDRIFRELCDVGQVARATNAQFNIGSGTLNAATQTANPINTKI